MLERWPCRTRTPHTTLLFSRAGLSAYGSTPRSIPRRLFVSFSSAFSFHGRCAVVSNVFFTTLLTETWEVVPNSGGMEYKAVGKSDVFALATDLALVWDPEFKAQVELYAQDNELFLLELGLAWTALMNADRFDGPTGSVCDY